MKKILVYLILIATLGCSNSLDIKEYRIEFSMMGGTPSRSSVEGALMDAMTYFDFDINNYRHCTSARLVCYFSSSAEISNAFIEVFNLTDSTVITNSTVSTTSTSEVWVHSDNFIDQIPDGPIDITLRFRNEIEEEFVRCRSAYLYLENE